MKPNRDLGTYIGMGCAIFVALFLLSVAQANRHDRPSRTGQHGSAMLSIQGHANSLQSNLRTQAGTQQAASRVILEIADSRGFLSYIPSAPAFSLVGFAFISLSLLILFASLLNQLLRRQTDLPYSGQISTKQNPLYLATQRLRI